MNSRPLLRKTIFSKPCNDLPMTNARKDPLWLRLWRRYWTARLERLGPRPAGRYRKWMENNVRRFDD